MRHPSTMRPVVAGMIKRPPWTLPVIVFAQFAGTSIWFSGNAVLAELMQRWASASPMAGWITSAVQLGFIAGTLVFAIFAVSDRFSPRWVFLVCAAAGALSNLLTGLAGNSLACLLTLRFVTGFFLAGIYPVGMKIAAGWYQKGLGNALGFLIGALVLGTAFPHLLKGGLSMVPWQAVIVLSSAVCLLGGLLMFLLIPDGPYQAVGARFNPMAVISLFRHRYLRAAALGYFGHMWELYTLWAFAPAFLRAYLSSAPSLSLNVSVWSFLIIGMGSVGCSVGGLFSAHVGSARVAFIQLGTSGLCCLFSPLFFDAPPALFLAFMLLWGMAVVGDSPQFSTIVARSAPRELVGSALTLVNCIGFSITVVSLSLMQRIASRVPPPYLLVILAFGPVVGLVCMKSLVGKDRATPPSEDQN
jgi:MFS family permease